MLITTPQEIKNLLKNNKSLFLIKPKLLETNYDIYIKQYKSVIGYVFKMGLEENVYINPVSYPLLFCIRHYIELVLKSSINHDNNTLKTHNIEELLGSIHNPPQPLIRLVSAFDEDENASIFRYIFPKHDYSILQERLSLESIFHDLRNINEVQEVDCQEFSRKQKTNTTLELQEITCIGQLNTQYDNMIILLIEGISNNNLDINDIIFPLLFFIRHSIELILKSNIEELIPTISKEEQESININDEHSLAYLYNKFESIIKNKIDLIHPGYQTKDLNRQSKKLIKDFIHQLDSDSLYFRYPIQLKKRLTKKSLYQIIDKYSEINSYLNFVVPVMLGEDIIQE